MPEDQPYHKKSWILYDIVEIYFSMSYLDTAFRVAKTIFNKELKSRALRTILEIYIPKVKGSEEAFVKATDIANTAPCETTKAAWLEEISNARGNT